MAAPRATRRTLACLALVGGTWVSLAAVDWAVGVVSRRAGAEPARVEAAVEVPAPGDGSGAVPRGRVFLLFVDSLRPETADALPSLNQLRADGLLVHVSPTQDASTVPSIRAAFTGETQHSIFAFVRNFVRGGDSLPSLFTQLAARGDAAVVFSDRTFREMAADIAAIRPNEMPSEADARGADERTRQHNAFVQALSTYERESYALVVFHLTIGDHAAHAFGVRHPAYHDTFRAVDDFVRRASASVRPGDTLVVMGDHGHDPTGRHQPGMKVPTVAYYRGPGFRPGIEIGPVPLTIHRYLLSWALGLPLSKQYRGAGAASALRHPEPIPAAFVSPPPEVSSVTRGRERLLLMLPILAAIGLVVAAVARAALRTSRASRILRLRPSVAALIATAGFVAWGVFLFHRRASTVVDNSEATLRQWLIMLVVACVVVALGRVRRMTATWALLALPALLLYPSSDRGSWAARMGQVWAIALAVLVTDWSRRLIASWRDRDARRTMLAQAWAIGGVGLLAVLVMPFFYVESEGLVFYGWRGYLTSDRGIFWMLLSTAANLILLVRPSRGLKANAVAFCMVALVVGVSFHAIAPAPKQGLLLAALLGSAALATRLLARGGDGAAAALTNAALLVAYRATVALDDRGFLQLPVLLAALKLSATVSDALGRPEDRESFANWLQAMALLVVTWTTLALSLERLEWHILYEFFSPPFVEEHVGFFLPVIVGRYAIPLVLARRLLAERRPAAQVSAWYPSFGSASIKVVTLVLVIAGYAIVDPSSELYLEAVQNLLTFSAPLLALAYEPRATV